MKNVATIDEPAPESLPVLERRLLELLQIELGQKPFLIEALVEKIVSRDLARRRAKDLN